MVPASPCLSCRALGVVRAEAIRSDSELRSPTEAMAGRLTRAGTSVDEVKLPDSFAAVLPAHRIIMHVEATAAHADLFQPQQSLWLSGGNVMIEIAPIPFCDTL